MTIDIKKTVLIVGCGPAGLGAIEQFLRKGFEVVAYEARDSVGGLWNYDPNPPLCRITYDSLGHAVALTEAEQHGRAIAPPTPVYAGVKANTPRDIMPYRSHPYPAGTDDAPTYKVIKAYQDRHAKAWESHIRLGRIVTRLRHTPADHSAQRRWLVTWTPSETSNSPDVGRAFEEGFDHVVVANGTDSRPFIPFVDGLWEWTGEIQHSRWYRDPTSYAGKTVLVVGAGPSSADEVRELGLLKVSNSPLAPKKIYRSYRAKLRYDTELEKGWQHHIQSVGAVARADGPHGGSPHGSIVTAKGEVLDDIDVIIFATGFVARFEFCQPGDAPWDTAPLLRYPTVPVGASQPPVDKVGPHTLEGGHRVHNLDAYQLFYLPDPSIAFLLLHAEAIPWPFSEMQARVVASYWTGTPIDLRPHADEENDGHSVLVLGHPGEFDYAEHMLRLIGEGGPEEVDNEGRWGAWPEWKKAIRAAID